MANAAGVLLVLLFLLPGLAFPLLWKRGGGTWMRSSYEYALVETATASPKGYTWYDCRDVCLAEGGDLWSVPGDRYMFIEFFTKLSIDSYVWTGVNRIEEVDEWKWSDGNPDAKQIGAKQLGFHDPNKKCGALLPKRSPQNASFILLHSFKAWKGMNCGDELLGFVCERRIGVVGPTTSPKTTPNPALANYSCPSGWRDAGTNRCYMEFEGPSSGLDWKTAERTCLSLPNYKPNLACANSQREIDALTRVATSQSPARYWFGLFKEIMDGPWMWADNTRFTNVTNFHRYFGHKLDYGRGVIDNRATPRGSWDVASDRDGLRSVMTRYICQVEKDSDF